MTWIVTENETAEQSMRGFAWTGSFPLADKAIKEKEKRSRILHQGAALILTLLPLQQSNT